jgi:hypothetical protein
MKALGLLVRLLSRPDNWRTNSESLAREFDVGKDQIRTVLNELQEFGYMQLVKSQNELGHWESTWIVYEESEHYLPEPENQGLGKPDSGKPRPNTRTDLTSTDNKPLVSEDSGYQAQITTEDLFNIFWQKYPRKTNKEFARKVYLKLKPSLEQHYFMLDALSIHIGLWKDPQYIPHPSTWLNGKRWLDEVDSRTDQEREVDKIRKEYGFA